jgi:GTP cyclohydrolase IA
MESEVAGCVADLLAALRIAPDDNTRETPERVARMLVNEIFAGRYTAPPQMTAFPNDKHLDQLYAVGPVTVRSCCAHHLVPILGHAWMGVLPNERLIGLSKFSRLTDWVMARPQIQEEATAQLADELWQSLAPAGLAVVVRARHFCCAWRGIRDEGQLMTTSIMRGAFRTGQTAPAEFWQLIAGMGYRQ